MSTSLPVISISKSRYLAGQQCAKRLYWEEHEPETRDEPDAATLSIQEGGFLVGALARDAFEGGHLIETRPDRLEDVFQQTKLAMADPSVPAIFEAAFHFQGTTVFVDVLERVGPDTFDLIEVKSSNEVKPHHRHDVAMQLWALQQMGVSIREVRVLHPRADYTKDGEVRAADYFQTTDLTDDLHEEMSAVPQTMAEQRQILVGAKPPEQHTGSHCNKPHRCPFYSRCHPTPKQGEHPVRELPWISQKAQEYLRESGIDDVRKIPDGLTYPQEYTEKTGKPKKLKEVLTERQRRVWNAVVTGEPYIDREAIKQVMDSWTYPVHFLDFETAAALLPLYDGMRPGQPVLFQFSNHTLTENGRLYHREFIQSDEQDPRRDFFKHLKRAVRGEGTVVVYSSYEEHRLAELVNDFPEYEEDVQQMVGRFSDLLKVVREHYYHPDMRGSASIKDVLPILAPDLSYKDLEIRDGATAQAVYFEMIAPETPMERRAEISTHLLRYCGRDTEAMVRVALALKRIAYEDPTQAREHTVRKASPVRRAVRR